MAGPHKTWVPFFGWNAESVNNPEATQYAGGFFVTSLKRLGQPFTEYTVLETRGYATLWLRTSTSLGAYRLAWGAEMAFSVNRLRLSDSDLYEAGYPADPFCTISLCDVNLISAEPVDPPFISKGSRKVSTDEDVICEVNYWWDLNGLPRDSSFLIMYGIVQARVLIQY